MFTVVISPMRVEQRVDVLHRFSWAAERWCAPLSTGPRSVAQDGIDGPSPNIAAVSVGGAGWLRVSELGL